MEDKQFKKALRNWTNGNRSDLDRTELIALVEHFETLYSMESHELEEARIGR